MKSRPHEGVLFTSAELAEAIGADPETIKNWVRRGIISRTRIGGRQMPNRLFSADEVYKTAVRYELVKLGLAPSAATEAVNTIWDQCNGTDILKEKDVYAILFPIDEKWTTVFCSQREQGGPLYKLPKLAARSLETIRLPDRAFAMVPITGTLTRITKRLESAIEATKEANVPE
jgi:MerR HTH family regulatory protein